MCLVYADFSYSNHDVEFTQQEIDWLNEDHTVRIHTCNYRPYCIVDEYGDQYIYGGIALDYIVAILNEYSIDYDFVIPSEYSCNESIIALTNKEDIDMIPVAEYTHEADTGMLYTQVYAQAPYVVFTLENSQYISTLYDLSGKTIVVSAGCAARELLEEEYPDIDLILVDDSNTSVWDSVQSCLEILSSGNADAFVGNLTVTSYVILKQGYTNIKVAAPTSFEISEKSMAVRDDWPELVSIINKTLDAYTAQEHSQITSKWLDVEDQHDKRWWRIVVIVLVSSIVLLILLYFFLKWNMKLSREIEKQKNEKEKNRIRLSQMSSSANLGLWNYYPLKGIIEVNSVWCEQLGYKSYELRDSADEWAELAGGKDKWIDLMHEDDLEHVITTLADYLLGNIDEYHAEYRIRGKDGNYRWILGTGSSIDFDSEGIAVQMTGVHILIDEIKEVQNQLEITKEKALKASKIKSVFLANMSHEIRTPMNAVIGFSELLMHTKLNAKQKDYLNNIRVSSKNLLATINDILDFSKLESGKLPIEKINFTIDEVLVSLASVTSHHAYAQGLELLIYMNPAINHTFIGDPYRLGQVLLNLTENAIKFTDKGEVLITVDLVEVTDTAKIKFSIFDSGIGMTKEQMENLFVAFQQADASTTRKYGGTGLGLAISRNIINLMGSDIEVESRLGRGSTFSFILNLEIESNIIQPENIIPDDIKDIKILVIDKNDTSRFIIEKYLGGFNNKPIIASSCEEAYGRVKEQAFDLLIIDYIVPTQNGTNMWEKLRNCRELDDNTKIIILCNCGLTSMNNEVINRDFSQLVTKPFARKTLVSAIRSVCMNTNDNEEIADSYSVYPLGFEQVIGAKILLAEDDDINQQVAKEILESEGFYVDIAVNGTEAVAMAQNSKYDIVLMDLQMPVMDGYLAAENIRRIIPYELPVIALSADVLSDVRQNVLNAGMNDYLSKPINKKELLIMLVRWIKPGKRDKNIRVTSYEMSINIDYLSDTLKDIDVIDGMNRAAYNIDLYLNLLEKFSEKYDEFFDELLTDIQNDNIDKAKKDIHTLKGVSGNIGAVKIYKYAVRIERCLKNNELDSIENIIKCADYILKDIVSQIKTIITKNRKLKGKSISTEDITNELLVKKLKNLYEYLCTSSMNALDAYEDILKYKVPQLIREKLSLIEKKITNLDFDDASEDVSILIDYVNES